MTGQRDNVISRLFTNPAWMRDAPCAGLTDLFYPDQHGNGERQQGEQAKTICASCPNRVRCLEYALDNGEIHGFWGGTSPNDRRTITQNRRDMGWTTSRNRNLVKCGSVAGYRKHLRDGQPPCPACTHANRDDNQQRMARRAERRAGAA